MLDQLPVSAIPVATPRSLSPRSHVGRNFHKVTVDHTSDLYVDPHAMTQVLSWRVTSDPRSPVVIMRRRKAAQLIKVHQTRIKSITLKFPTGPSFGLSTGPFDDIGLDNGERARSGGG